MPGAVRRRGVLDPAAGDAAASRRSRSPTGSAARSPRACSRSRRRASRSAPRSRSASPRFPRDGEDANELVHQADLAVYRAKLQGRNRVLDASDEPLLAQPDNRTPRLAVAARRAGERVVPLAAAAEIIPEVERRQTARPHTAARAALLLGAAPPRAPRRRSSASSGIAAGVAGAIFGSSTDVVGLVDDRRRSSASARRSRSRWRRPARSRSAPSVRSRAPRSSARAPRSSLAITMSAVEWSARRAVFHQLLFNVGALSLASLGAAAVFSVAPRRRGSAPASSSPAGCSPASSTSSSTRACVSIAVGLEGRESPRRVWQRALQLAGAALRSSTASSPP